MKKFLTILMGTFIIFLLSSCGKNTQPDNIGTIQGGSTQQEGLITTPGVDKESYSNGFTQ